MEKRVIKDALCALVEPLAEIEHQRWSHWQRYIHDHGTLQPDGSLLLPSDLVNRWEQQMATGYANLTAAEKESDREQVRRYLPVFVDEVYRIFKDYGNRT